MATKGIDYELPKNPVPEELNTSQMGKSGGGGGGEGGKVNREKLLSKIETYRSMLNDPANKEMRLNIQAEIDKMNEQLDTLDNVSFNPTQGMRPIKEEDYRVPVVKVDYSNWKRNPNDPEVGSNKGNWWQTRREKGLGGKIAGGIESYREKPREEK